MAKSKKKKKQGKGESTPVKTVEVDEEAPARPSIVRGVFNEPVALLLALFVVLRPWRDGMTYPHFNVFYVVAIAAVAVGFFAYRCVKGQGFRFGSPIALFTVFLVIAYLTVLAGVNYDTSLRQFLQQGSYFFLFLLASQGLRTRLGVGIVLTALLMTSLVNTVWAVVHAEFVLPFVRESIANKPALLEFYFGSSVLTPELKHRLEMSRAFGTFLHPNALAAYLVLCIPVMVGWGAGSFSKMKAMVDADKSDEGWLNSNFATLLVGALAGFFMYFYLYSLNTLLLSHTDGAIPLIAGTARTVFYLAILPITFSLVSGYLVHLKGVLGYGRILGTLLMFLAGMMQVYALWLTYSRGAMAGLLFGLLLAAVWLVLAAPRTPLVSTFGRRFSELAAVVFIGSSLLYPAAQALDLRDDGFVLPDTKIDYRPQSLSYDASELSVEGRDVSVSEFVSAQSLGFRWTYWQVCYRVIADNFFTGVGLSNFGTVYGAYQFLDAHDVRTAHNDYLQMFSEVGVFGFIAFMAFWVYFLGWGGARIVRETDWKDRLLLAGIYAGIVSFLAHAFVDFDFQNPSLAMMLYTMVGVFFACAGFSKSKEDSESRSSFIRGRIPVVVCAIFSVLVLLGSVRQARYDYGWSVGTPYERTMDIGNRFKKDIPAEMLDFLVGTDVQNWNGKGNPPFSEIFKMRLLIDDDEAIRKLGMVRVRLNDGTDGTKEIPVGEPLPDNGFVFVTDRNAARALALEVGPVWLQRLEDLEKSYPHGTDVPRLGYRFTRAMVKATTDETSRLRYSEACLDWARKRAERSPKDPEAQIELCGALWERGRQDKTIKQLEYYRDGVAVYREAMKLHPTSQQMFEKYAESMAVIGNAFLTAGEQAVNNPPIAKSLTEEGQEYMKMSQDAYRRRDLLVRYKHDVLQLR